MERRKPTPKIEKFKGPQDKKLELKPGEVVTILRRDEYGFLVRPKRGGW